MTVGDRIRQVRIEKDITQQELADCAGVSKQAVYKYENNIESEEILELLKEMNCNAREGNYIYIDKNNQ